MKQIVTLFFLTGFLLLHGQVTIDGNEALKKLPWYFYYANSYSQNIYQQNIINASGEITGIKLHYADTSTEHTNQVSLYLGHTVQTEFNGPDAWVDSNGLTEVFSGEVNFIPGTWIEFTFSTPFDYNGVDNLVLGSLESSEGYDDDADNFVSMPIYYNSSLSAYSDSNILSEVDLPADSVSGTTNAVQAFLPHIQFLGITSDCDNPKNLVATDIASDSATISWDANGTASDYHIVYKADEDFNPYSPTDVESATSTEATLQLQNLDPATTYYAYVQTNCSNSEASSFSGPIEIQTLSTVATIPYTQDFEGDVFPPNGWTVETTSGNEWEILEDANSAHSGSNALQYSANTTEDANAWIFSIGVELEGNKTYNLSFFQRILDNNATEKLKLSVGTSNNIGAQATTLWDNNDLTNGEYTQRLATFKPDTSGLYYFAFQAYSEKDQKDILIDDFSITKKTLFTEVTDRPGNYWYSSLNWGDYDNDGDADLLISGAHPTEDAPYDAGVSSTHVYSNDGDGNFSLNEDIILQGVHAGDAKWIDYDNDGDLDIIMMGIDYATAYNMYALYENENGTFTQVEVGPNAVSWGGISTGDYDNDGDVDVLMSGWNVDDEPNGYASTYIWNNEDGNLVREDITRDIPGLFGGRADWADIDNDMDLDIIISPEYGADQAMLRVYTRENDSYTLTQTLSDANSYSMFALGDYNNDGYIDIAVETTDENYNNFVQVHKNNNGNFELKANIPSVSSSGASSPLAWGDYDNDGDLDLAFSGLDPDYNGKAILIQNTNGEFDVIDNTGFASVGGHSLAWQDIDGDLDLDILVTGFIDDATNDEFYGTSRLYTNMIESVNTAPNAPNTFTSEAENGFVTFNWSGANDVQTPEDGLQYYLQVGSTSGGVDVAHYPVNGNAWKLKIPTDVESLYWCVKAVDTSFVKSVCSDEQSISNLATSELVLSDDALKIYPNPVNDGIIHLVTSELENTDLDIKLFDMLGKVILQKEYKNVQSVLEISVDQLPTGKYFLKYTSADKQGAIAVIIN